MAQYQAINAAVKVNGATVHAFVNSMRRGTQKRIEILKKHGIDNLQHDLNVWYSQQSWLNAFKEFSEITGDKNLFIMGAAITKNASFPPMKDLEHALGSINIAYHMNHQLDNTSMFNPQTGEIMKGIGHYILQSFDKQNRKAIMYCDNPYPSEFDRGILTEIVRMFKPENTSLDDIKVKLDPSKETRLEGADSCTYIIQW